MNRGASRPAASCPWAASWGRCGRRRPAPLRSPCSRRSVKMAGDSSAHGPVVVKVGGSLYDLPDLGPRLGRWLGASPGRRALLVPGGGPTADVIRQFDACHGLGEATAHELALRALTLNAHFLAALVPAAVVVDDPAR